MEMRERYRADAVRMPMIPHDLLAVLSFYRITVVQRRYPETALLSVCDNFVLLLERKVEV